MYSVRKSIVQILSALLFIFLSIQVTAQTNDNEAGKFDPGTMWSFSFPPVQYLEDTYGLKATDEWLEDVRLSALRIPGCTASFVSEDGLIMTNNHCSDDPREAVEREGENLAKNGFYAPTLAEERKVPDFYADQLVFMKDVTEEIQSAIDKGSTETEKIANKDGEIENLTAKYKDETGLHIEIESFYNDSKYAVYGYKRYTDIRVVFLPEDEIAFFGGDYDNFTYPRYNLDCAFYRVYENNEPVKSRNFFKWSKNGAQKDEVIFTVGNPGRTNRLKTVSQLIYLRDIYYGNLAFMFDGDYKALEKYKSVYPEKADDLEKFRTGIGNGQKVTTNIVSGLSDPALIAMKSKFENKLKEKVKSDPELSEKYGKIWDVIDDAAQKLTEYNKKISIFKPGKRRIYPSYFSTAAKLVKLAEQLELPEDKRSESFKGEKLDEYKKEIFPAKYDELIEKIKLSVFVDMAVKNLGSDHYVTRDLFKGLMNMKAAEYLLENSVIKNRKDVEKLINSGANDILRSNDIFIKFVLATKDELNNLEKLVKETTDIENVNENLLGQLIYKIYGTTIPPDANFTLRISDGVLKSFDYNGTIAPLKTTYFGLYNRYYSFDKEYPWNLPVKWENPSKDLDLATPFNFISTNDIVGGNSGSAIINQNAEIVGLAFDGNINSIIGNFIYLKEDNRCVGLASEGMVEAFRHLYGYKKLADELENGKLTK